MMVISIDMCIKQSKQKGMSITGQVVAKWGIIDAYLIKYLQVDAGLEIMWRFLFIPKYLYIFTDTDFDFLIAQYVLKKIPDEQCLGGTFDTHADVDFDIVLEGGAEDCDSSPQKEVESNNKENIRAVGRIVPAIIFVLH